MALRDEMMKNIYSDKDAKKIQVHPIHGSFPLDRGDQTQKTAIAFEYRGTGKLMALDLYARISYIGQTSANGVNTLVYPNVVVEVYLDGELLATSITQDVTVSGGSIIKRIQANKYVFAGELMKARLNQSGTGREVDYLNGFLNGIQIRESLVVKVIYQATYNVSTMQYIGGSYVTLNPIDINNKGLGIVIVED